MARIFAICKIGFPKQEKAKNINERNLNLKKLTVSRRRKERKLPNVEYCLESSLSNGL